MAQRQFRSEFLHSHNKGLTLIEGEFEVDSSQTTAGAGYKIKLLSTKGTGIDNIRNVATGVYRIDLSDNYFKLLGFNYSTKNVLGTQVAIASLSNGVPYVIKTLGTSAQADWVLAGMPSDITAAVGVAFTAVTAASGSTGNGYAAPMITNGVVNVALYGNPDTTINSASPSSTKPYLYIHTMYAAATNITAPAAPVDGTVIRFQLLLRNSNMVGTGE